MSARTVELRYPLMGVGRRNTLRSTPDFKGPWPSPWAANCRVCENLDRRLRGGSRPGLTKYSASSFGTIADMASMNVSSTTGASSLLVVLGGSTLYKVDGGTASNPIPYASDDGSSNQITNAGGDNLVFGTGSAPAAGFIVTGRQFAYAVTTSGITRLNPKTGQIDAVEASAGTIPTNCTFGAMYRDRLCMSGQDNAIYMSRMGDYTDWAFGANAGDQGRPLAFQLALAADVGPLPTAMIPHKDTHLLVGTENSLWVVSGDPAADGTLRRISENVGILSKKAWCKIEDTVCFLSNDGVYRVQTDGSGLTAMSDKAVPAELLNVNPSTTTITMGYEHDRMAVHVFLRTSGGSDNHWVYELESEAWWPVRFADDDHSPLATCQHDGQLLLAGSDGYVRYVGGNDDDGTSIASHVAIGPVRIGQSNHFGRILNLHGIVAAGSGSVTWRLVTGNTAEEAADNVKLAIEAFQAGNSYASYVHSSGTWTAGRAVMSYPRARAVWMCLWLQSTARWAFEGAVMETVQSGKWRGA